MKQFSFLLLFIPAVVVAQDKTGCISGDCRFGFGVYVFPSGDRYEGYFKDQKLNGFGYYTEARGNKYTGEFKDNKFHGVGKYESMDGTYYIGQFENGIRQGLGTNYFSKTYFEKGKWENNRYVDKAEFEDFVVTDPNQFAGDIIRIIREATDDFKGIKGEPISKLVANTFHSTVKLKFFSEYQISPDGFTAVYYTGSASDAAEKFEELKQLIQPCLAYDCCSYNHQSQESGETRYFEFFPYSVRSGCDARLMNVRVRLDYKTMKGSVTVCLRIYSK